MSHPGVTVSFDAGTDLGTTGLILKHDPARLTDPGAANSPANLVIDGGGRIVDLTGSPTGSPLITVGKGVTLTLRNITFKGLRAGETDDTGDNTASLIKVDGGHLILETGTISGNTASSTGGGVFVDNTTTTFTMKTEAIISGNNAASYGGGVFVEADGTFEKTGGVIYGKDKSGKDANEKPLKNTASADGKGHAVYDDRVSKATDTTLGVNVDYPSRDNS